MRYDRFTQTLPEHKFGLNDDDSIYMVYLELTNYHPSIKEALEKKNLQQFISLIAEYASFFMRRIAKDQKGDLAFIEAYHSIVREFLEFYNREQGIHENNLSDYLSERAIIEYVRTGNLCIQLFGDYQELTDPTEASLTDFAKFFVVRPFILSLFPVKESTLEELSRRSVDFNLEKEHETTVKETICNTVLQNDKSDKELIADIGEKIKSIHQRLNGQSTRSFMNFFNASARNKIHCIVALYKLTQETKTTLDDLEKALSKATENPEIVKHRHWFKRHLPNTLFKPPTILQELGAIQKNLLQKNIHPCTIGRKFSV